MHSKLPPLCFSYQNLTVTAARFSDKIKKDCACWESQAPFPKTLIMIRVLNVVTDLTWEEVWDSQTQQQSSVHFKIHANT